MKYLKYVSLLVVVLFLTGCQETTTEPQEQMSLNESVQLMDESEEYDFETSTLNLYDYSYNTGIMYVDVEEFLTAISPALKDFEVTSLETLQVVFDLGGDNNTLMIELDPTDNSLYYSNFNQIYNINDIAQSDGNDDSDLYFASQLVESGDVEKTISLEYYDIKVVNLEEQYYIPLYLANFLFSGAYFNVYLDREKAYLYDDVYNVMDFFSDQSLHYPLSDYKLIITTANFTAFLLDHYYGIKDDLGIADFKVLMTNLGLFDYYNLADFDEAMQEFLYSLDDLHTGIIDMGYHNEEVEILYPLMDTRTYNAWVTLENNGYYGKNYDIIFEETEYYYYLDILEFNGDTEEYIAEHLVDLDPSKALWIDLSTCLGGNIRSVFEVLSYLTNDSITYSYWNPQTGTLYRDMFQSQTDKAVENSVILFVSEATFSAANLLTSIVKDNDLAAVVGSTTAGGSTIVFTTLLPNNMVLSYSGNIQFLDSERNSIEFGVSPDIEAANLNNVDEAYYQVTGDLRENLLLYVENRSYSQYVDIEFQFTELPTQTSIHDFTIYIYDEVTGECIYQEELEAFENYHFTKVLTEYRSLIRVELIAHYTLMGKELSYRCYQDSVDDMANVLTPNTLTIPINEVFHASVFENSERDFIKVTINTLGAYQVMINGTKSSGNKIYDLNGDFLEEGSIFILEPGTYIIKLNTPLTIQDYFVMIRKMADDNLFGTNVEVGPGTKEVTLHFDYVGDEEWIDLTINQESYVTLTIEDWNTYFEIRDSSGELYHEQSVLLSIDDNYTFILAAGEYRVNFLDDYPICDMVITITSTIVENDFSGDFTLTDSNVGTLVEGNNTITIDGAWDRDIYQYVTTEEQIIVMDPGYLLNICLITEGDLICNKENQSYYLEPGVHYFVFESLFLLPGIYTVPMEVLIDTSTLTNMTPIDFDTTIEYTLEYGIDIDYFTFTVAENSNYRIEFDSERNVVYTLYLNDGNWDEILVIENQELVIQIPTGDYVLTVSQVQSDSRYVIHGSMTISMYELSDPDPNITGLDSELYRTFVIPQEEYLMFTGAIDYVGDWDVYLLDVTQAGSYMFSSFSSEAIQIYVIIDGEWFLLDNNDEITLDIGTYECLVRQYGDLSITEYTVFINLIE